MLVNLTVGLLIQSDRPERVVGQAQVQRGRSRMGWHPDSFCI